MFLSGFGTRELRIHYIAFVGEVILAMLASLCIDSELLGTTDSALNIKSYNGTVWDSILNYKRNYKHIPSENYTRQEHVKDDKLRSSHLTASGNVNASQLLC